MSLNLTNILQNPSQTNQIQAGPNAGRQTGVVLEDSASVTWSTDGFGNIQAAAGVSSPSGMTLIQTQTLSAPAATVTFSAIPQTFTHLFLVISAQNNQSAINEAINLQFNGDTGGDYFTGYILNNQGTILGAGGPTPTTSMLIGQSASSPYAGSTDAVIAGYSNTTLAKTVTSKSTSVSGTAFVQMQGGGVWSNTAAINSIVISGAAGTFSAGSIFSLYGIQ